MPGNVIAMSRTTSGLSSALRVSVMRLSRRLRNERDVSDDMSSNQMAVLFTLARSGPLTIGDLAAEEKVQPPSMTRTVNSLVAKSLIVRGTHETDRRVAVITLSDTGRSVIDESRRRKEAWLHQRLCELTPAQRQILRDAAPVLELLSRA
ncbi:MAG: MarR family transcriptional regulator [Nocardioidaceae bacterium]